MGSRSTSVVTSKTDNSAKSHQAADQAFLLSESEENIILRDDAQNFGGRYNTTVADGSVLFDLGSYSTINLTDYGAVNRALALSENAVQSAAILSLTSLGVSSGSDVTGIVEAISDAETANNGLFDFSEGESEDDLLDGDNKMLLMSGLAMGLLYWMFNT